MIWINGDSRPLGNEQLAERLLEIAERLEAQSANPFRVRAYRTAAGSVRALNRPVHEIVAHEGTTALTSLSGIGPSLARALEILSRNGHLPLLEQLRAAVGPEDSFATVSGIGPKTAARIHAALSIDTLAELEAAAYDGRLAAVPGIGRKRLRAVQESLAGRLRHLRPISRSPKAPPQAPPPAVDEILDVDDEYRRKGGADRLLRIAPRRFNPSHEAWLPILETRRGENRYTALYSNTARAHELGTVTDWVVIYRDSHSGGGQWTVITSRFGALRGRRVIRGREAECAAHYAKIAAPPAGVRPDSDAQLRLDAPPTNGPHE
jgi:predicted flap endonuclease-1-like 5' DNA nuclease